MGDTKDDEKGLGIFTKILLLLAMAIIIAVGVIVENWLFFRFGDISILFRWITMFALMPIIFVLTKPRD